MTIDRMIHAVGTALLHADYWLLWALLLGIPGCAWRARTVWMPLLRRLPRGLLGGLAVVLLVAAVLRLNPDRWEHNVFDDEYVHGELAYNMGRHRLPVLTAELAGGTPMRTAPVWPPGHHFLLGLVLPATGGYSERAAFLFNALTGIFCAGLAFGLAGLLFRNGFAALAAGLYVAAWPLHARLSNGASTEITAHAMLLIFALSVVLCVRRCRPATYLLACLAATWAAMMRPELFVVAPLTAIGLHFLTRYREPEAPISPTVRMVGFAPLLLPLLHAPFSIQHYHGQRNALEHHCLLPALRYWFQSDLYTPCWTVLGICGVVWLLCSRRRMTAAILVAFWIGYVLVVSVYRRVDPTLGDLQRYFVLGGTVPVLFSAGFAGYAWSRHRGAAAIIFAITMACCLVLLPHARIPLSPMAQGRRAQTEWLEAHRDVIPPGARLFSRHPSFVWSVTAHPSYPLQRLPGIAAARKNAVCVVYDGFDLLPNVPGQVRMKRTGAAHVGNATPVTMESVVQGALPLAEGVVLGRPVGLYRVGISPQVLQE